MRQLCCLSLLIGVFLAPMQVQAAAVGDSLRLFSQHVEILQKKTDSPETERRRLRDVAGVCLAFLGAGYDHRCPNHYRKTSRKLLEIILAVEPGTNGMLASDLVTHALCSMAVAEAYAMTQDAAIRQAAQTLVDTLIEVQRPEGWWSASLDTQEIHLLGTTLSCMALKSAASGGLKVDRSFERLKAWCFPELRQLKPEADPSHSGKLLLMCIFLGLRQDDQAIDLCAAMMEHPASFIDSCEPMDAWFWILACFQVGDISWKRYNQEGKPRIIERNAEDRAKLRDNGQFTTGMWIDTLCLEIYNHRLRVR